MPNTDHVSSSQPAPCLPGRQFRAESAKIMMSSEVHYLPSCRDRGSRTGEPRDDDDGIGEPTFAKHAIEKTRHRTSRPTTGLPGQQFQPNLPTGQAKYTISHRADPRYFPRATDGDRDHRGRGDATTLWESGGLGAPEGSRVTGNGGRHGVRANHPCRSSAPRSCDPLSVSPLTYNKWSLKNDHFVLGLPPGTYTLP